MVSVLTPEFQANQIVLDSKCTYNLPLKALGTWTTVSTQRSLRLPFHWPKGELILEIPFFDAAYHAKKIVENFGFSQDARILVVDDSATTRKLSRHYLACAGFQNVEECEDGGAALQKVTNSPPPFDLVIADWHMPVMTGIEMLKKIRASKDFKALPVILVTGERNAAEVGNAVKEGVSGYVVKPFDSDALYKAMKKAHAVGAAIAAKNAAALAASKKAA